MKDTAQGTEERNGLALKGSWSQGHQAGDGTSQLVRGRPGSTYPLVFHSLLCLVQDPLHFLDGHHLERVRFEALFE